MDLQPTEAFTSESLKFKGNAKEYFRIWIVNIALTILTFGIYSAWAKVRSRKYLYGNTELMNTRFDYHADPIKILKGRLIVGAIFLCYTIAGKISIKLAIAVMLIWLLIFPWIYVRALVFNLSNTSYRNIRFGFSGTTKESYLTSLLATLISVLTLGLGAPYAYYMLAKFKFSGIKFGKLKSQYSAKASDFYLIILVTVSIYIISAVAYGLLVVLARPLFDGNPSALVAPAIILYLGLGFAIAYIRASLTNLNLNNTSLGKIELISRLKTMQLFGLYFTNFIACLFTLGLLIPWAIVRTLQYRYAHTTVQIPASTISNIEQELNDLNVSAAADAATDFWDIDLGI